MLQSQEIQKNRNEVLKKLDWLNQNLVQCQRDEKFARDRKDRQQKLMFRVGYVKKANVKQEQIRKRQQDALLREVKMRDLVVMLQTEIRTLRGELKLDV